MRDLILSILIAFAVCMIAGPFVISMLRKQKMGQQVRDDGPQTHLTKQGTPTMGGIIILLGLAVSCIILTVRGGSLSIPSLIATLGFGLVGFLDDIIKAVKKRSLGLRAYQKLIGQFGLALVIALFAYYNQQIGSKIFVPFANVEWDLGFWYVPVMMIIIVGLVNAVNLTDGLDGLASGTSMIISAGFGILFMYMYQRAFDGGEIFYAIGLKNMMVFSGALTGACLGFLRFNAHPAKVFMGDTGSLALGGAISMMAICSRLILIMPILGGIFFATIMSVVLQVGSYKLRKKRIFRMAPLHHHFELGGMKETRVVSMYMIVGALLCLVSLFILA